MSYGLIKNYAFLLLLITAVLANTALFNVGNSLDGGFGVPLYWPFLFALIPPVLLAVSYRFWVSFFCLNVVILIFVLVNLDSYFTYLTQYVSRVFLFFILLSFFFLKGLDFIFLLKRLYYFLFLCFMLAIVSFLGVKFFDFDLGLYNVANSSSFGFRGKQLNEVNGWVSQVRLTGVWSEPSYMTIPVLLLFYLNSLFKSRLYIPTIFILLFVSLFSFSRTIWLALSVLLFFSILRKSHLVTSVLYKFRLSVILLFFFLGSLGFVLYGSLAGNDNSTSGRIGSAVIGIEMIKKHAVFGMGPGTFSANKSNEEYALNNVDISNENVIHSAFISMWQQFGLLSFLFILLPYYLVLKNVKYNHFESTWPYVFTLPVVLVSSGDFTYFSYYWLFLGVLLVDIYNEAKICCK